MLEIFLKNQQKILVVCWATRTSNLVAQHIVIVVPGVWTPDFSSPDIHTFIHIYVYIYIHIYVYIYIYTYLYTYKYTWFVYVLHC